MEQKEALKKVVNGLFAEINPFVIQIYKKDGEAEPVEPYPLDSGVLLEINGNYYLCTASHTYHEERIEDIGTMIGDTLYIFKGELTYLPITDSEENNIGDVAVCKLLPEVAEDLKMKYQFLPMNRILLNHCLVAENRYFILGYPVTKSKKNPITGKLTVESFSFVTKGITNEDKYRRVKSNVLVNYLLEFHRNKIAKFGEVCKQTAPKPEGNSGSGLWYFDCERQQLLLVGLMIGYNHPEAVFIATRIDLVTELIRHKFDHSIPQSTAIKPRFTPTEKTSD